MPRPGTDRKLNEHSAPLDLAGRLVGPGHPVYVIAEVGVNHQGDPDLAMRLLEEAAAAGADAVKLQKRRLDALYTKDVLENTDAYERPYQYLIPILKRVELSEDAVRRFAARCGELGVQFLCTPFDTPSADFVASLDVPAFKVASCDLTNFDLLEHLAAFGKPLILSTGASSIDEIRRTARHLRRMQVRFALLHCNTTYPTRLDDVNLRAMGLLEGQGDVVGYSGHEITSSVPVAAVAMGACIIEKHITLDRAMEGPDHRASLLPDEFRDMVRQIREVERALGLARKRVTQGEILNREVLGKSIVAAASIPEGEVITRELIAVKSPARGLSPQRMAELLYRRARRTLAPDQYFTEGDIAAQAAQGAAPVAFGKWGLIVRPDDAEEGARFHPPVLEYHLTPRDLEREWAPARQECELVVHAPEYLGPNDLLDLCSLDEPVRRRSVGFATRVLERVRGMATQFNGRPKVVVHPGGATLNGITAAERGAMTDAFADSYRELRDAAEKDGLVLLPENLPPFPWYFGGQWKSQVFVDPEEIDRFIQREQAPICFDTSHAQLSCTHLGREMVPDAARLKPYVRHMHVADGDGVNGEGVQIGDGDVDFDALMIAYRDYEESWVPEIWRGHQNGGAGFLRALELLTKIHTRQCGS